VGWRKLKRWTGPGRDASPSAYDRGSKTSEGREKKKYPNGKGSAIGGETCEINGGRWGKWKKRKDTNKAQQFSLKTKY